MRYGDNNKVVDAILFTGMNEDDIISFCNKDSEVATPIYYPWDEFKLDIRRFATKYIEIKQPTRVGKLRANQYIVIDNNVYSIWSKELFEQTFKPI